MSPLERELSALGAREEDWRSECLDPAEDGGRARLAELVASGAVHVVHDRLDEQLAELAAARAPRSAHVAVESASLTTGRWIWYPWQRRLVHVLAPDEFRELRTNRNRFKITAAEQEELRSKSIGIVGLSVGNTAAVTLALEGIGGTFRLADHDSISLSNLNRLRAATFHVGLNKAVLAARQLLEIDPYLHVAPFPKGLTTADLDAFLDGLDLLIEECDDLHVKIAIRERARALGVPVIMDTSDRGLLDIERFDREPHRPVLHGLAGDLDAAALHALPTKAKIPIVLALLGGKQISKRLAASLPEIASSIVTWPQLASEVTLGAAIAADAARRILLGQLSSSGRFHVDLAELVRDDAAELATPPPPPEPHELAPEATRLPELPTSPPCGQVTVDAVRWLIAHAVLAPSAHNVQPWRFIARGSVLE